MTQSNASVQVYAFLLSLFAVFSARPSVATYHLNLVLGVAWLIYFIRDVAPFLTYTQQPADHGFLLWELFGVLTATGIVLPALTPRAYKPYDPSVRLFSPSYTRTSN